MTRGLATGRLAVASVGHAQHLAMAKQTVAMGARATRRPWKSKTRTGRKPKKKAGRVTLLSFSGSADAELLAPLSDASAVPRELAVRARASNPHQTTRSSQPDVGADLQLTVSAFPLFPLVSRFGVGLNGAAVRPRRSQSCRSARSAGISCR